jgi:hypothetical protein
MRIQIQKGSWDLRGSWDSIFRGFTLYENRKPTFNLRVGRPRPGEELSPVGYSHSYFKRWLEFT